MFNALEHYKERYADPNDPYKPFWASGIYTLMHHIDTEEASMWYAHNREHVLEDNHMVGAYRPRYKLRCDNVNGEYVLKSIPTAKQHKAFVEKNRQTLLFMRSMANKPQWVPLKNIPYHTKERRMAHIFAFFCHEYGHKARCFGFRKNKITYIQVRL